MSFWNQTMPSSPEMRERLFLVASKDLADLSLVPVMLYGALAPTQPLFCDVWAVAKLDDVLFGDFCVDVQDIPEPVRYASLRKLIGEAEGSPDFLACMGALASEPSTLFIVMWGLDEHHQAFAVLYHHPMLGTVEAKRSLLAVIGTGRRSIGAEA